MVQTGWCRVAPLVLSLCITGCGGREQPRVVTSGHDTHQIRFATVNGVRLQYLDWGGSGDGLMFLHGLGDSPHAYDEIAPVFADRFRFVAYARRGHGRSQAKGPYDNDTLVQDLTALLDHLGIQRVALVGWSLGGNEITEFAARHPDRVTAVVYLDCFDTADGLEIHNKNFPLAFFPHKNDLSSLPAFRNWQKRTWWPDTPWTPAMEAQAGDLVEAAPDGSVRLVTSDSIGGELFAGAYAYHARWTDVAAPVLAFFAEPYRGAFLPDDAPKGQQEQVDRFLKDYGLPLFEARIPKFRAAIPGARIVTLRRTNHGALPFQRRDQILEEMDALFRETRTGR